MQLVQAACPQQARGDTARGARVGQLVARRQPLAVAPQRVQEQVELLRRVVKGRVCSGLVACGLGFVYLLAGQCTGGGSVYRTMHRYTAERATEGVVYNLLARARVTQQLERAPPATVLRARGVKGCRGGALDGRPREQQRVQREEGARVEGAAREDGGGV